MRDREGAGRRQEAEVERSLTQVFYADGEKRSTAAVRGRTSVARRRSHAVRQCGECLDGLKTCECHLLISNARRPGVEGLELLLGARRIKPSVPVLVLVDHGDTEAAVRAMKAGAADCLEQPLETGPLVSSIQAALQKSVRRDSLRKRSLSPVEQQVLDLVLQGSRGCLSRSWDRGAMIHCRRVSDARLPTGRPARRVHRHR